MKVELTAGGVLGLAAVGAVAFIGYKVVKNGGAILEAFNPTSDQNLAYKAANSASIAVGLGGSHNGYSYDDHLFAAIDLLNPFNESDDYAGKVWGFGE